MKKVFFAFAVIAALASCGKENPSSKDPEVAKLEVKLTVDPISQDILDYFTVKYNYVDFYGNKVTKQITAPGTTVFSIDNPKLGEEASCPFTVELLFESNGKAAKTSGKYSQRMEYSLYVNGYYSDGSLITDSRAVQHTNSTIEFDNLDQFVKSTEKCGIASITYKTFFCQTISGEWHIGVDGTRN